MNDRSNPERDHLNEQILASQRQSRWTKLHVRKWTHLLIAFENPNVEDHSNYQSGKLVKHAWYRVPKKSMSDSNFIIQSLLVVST